MTEAAGLDPLLEAAIGWARKAGEATLRHFERGVDVETKPDHSPVTAADREAERIIRTAIEARFPDDGIVGEEFGETRPGASRRWILDPIDGTKSFIHGVPLYGVLIGLEVSNGPRGAESVLGVLHFPALGETVVAARGSGCYRNGVRCRVSNVDGIDRALALTTGFEFPPEARTGWDALLRKVAYARTWGDAWGYALVATGRAEVMVDPRLHLWDVAAVVPVIEEAGGVFTDRAGRSGHLVTDGIATNAALAREVRALLTS